MPESPKRNSRSRTAYNEPDGSAPKRIRPHYTQRMMRVSVGGASVSISVTEDQYQANTYHPVSSLLINYLVTSAEFVADPMGCMDRALVLALEHAVGRTGPGRA